MKILNLYAGIGGNRALWGDEHEVTAVEYDYDIFCVYVKRFPKDTVVYGDAQKYLLEHFNEFDMIWLSPPCQTHSNIRITQFFREGYERKLPDMTSLYGSIAFLETFYNGVYIVENVIPYYEPLIKPTATVGRHLIWSNRHVRSRESDAMKRICNEKNTEDFPDCEFVQNTRIKNKRQVMRNTMHSEDGLYVLNEVTKQ